MLRIFLQYSDNACLCQVLGKPVPPKELHFTWGNYDCEFFLLLLSPSLSSAAIRRGNRYIGILSTKVNWPYRQNHQQREGERGSESVCVYEECRIRASARSKELCLALWWHSKLTRNVIHDNQVYRIPMYKIWSQFIHSKYRTFFSSSPGHTYLLFQACEKSTWTSEGSLGSWERWMKQPFTTSEATPQRTE